MQEVGREVEYPDEETLQLQRYRGYKTDGRHFSGRVAIYLMDRGMRAKVISNLSPTVNSCHNSSRYLGFLSDRLGVRKLKLNGSLQPPRESSALLQRVWY